MKKILNLLPVLLGMTFVLSSCNEEIDILGDARESAVVYSVLDLADTVHYVKVTKAFLTTKNAYDVAKIPDSSYFDQVDVTITEVINGNNARVFTLKDTILTNKESGAFYAPEQKLYYFRTATSSPLLANSSTIYKLNVKVNNGEFEVNGETSLVSGVSISTPSPISSFTFANNNMADKGYATTVVKYAAGNSHIVDLSLNIGVDEFRGGDKTEITIPFKLNEVGGSDIENSTRSVLVNGETFYGKIKSGVTDDPTIDRRNLRHIEIVLTAGHPDLYKYIVLTKPSNSLTQNKLSFTNISATNGRNALGIFSSRTTVRQYKKAWNWTGGSTYLLAINNASMRELCIGQQTGLLKFCSTNPQDLSTNYSCN